MFTNYPTVCFLFLLLSKSYALTIPNNNSTDLTILSIIATSTSSTIVATNISTNNNYDLDPWDNPAYDFILNSDDNLCHSSVTLTLSTGTHFYDTLLRYVQYAALSYATKLDQITTGKLQNACPCVLCYDTPYDTDVEMVYRGIVSSVLFTDHTNKEIHLAIKGTTSNDEWLMDFTMIPLPYHPLSRNLKFYEKYFMIYGNCKGCLIHKGFYDGSKEIYNAMFPALLSLSNDYPDYSIVISGHSLGGAIAPLLGIELIILGKNPIIVSFGSPKIGDAKFKRWMDKSINTRENYNSLDNIHGPMFLRVSHKDDIVPLLPFKQMNFHHFGVDVFINKKDLPMENHHIQIKGSSNNLMQTTKKIDYKYYSESHKRYFLRLNMCVIHGLE